jgi:hypothetical protein
MNNADEAAVGKLFRLRPEPFEMVRYPGLIRDAQKSLEILDQQIAAETNEEIRENLKKVCEEGRVSLAKLEADKVAGDLYNFLFEDMMEMDVWMCAREEDRDHATLSPKMQGERLAWWRKRKKCQIVLRRSGTDGKVRVLTDMDLGSLPNEVVDAILVKHAECFGLREDQRPKAEAVPLPAS